MMIKEYSDTKWFTVLFTEKKISLNLRHILKILYGYFFIFFFYSLHLFTLIYIYLQPLNCHTMKHYYDANQPIEVTVPLIVKV